MNTFAAPETKSMFIQNEEIYDNHLSNFVDTYSKNSNSLNYFNELNIGLKNYTQESSKMCSKLKHMCYDLSGLVLKTSESLNAISDYFAKFNKFTNDSYSQLKIKQIQEVEDTNKKLEAGIYEWSKQLLTQSQHILDNMASFFHFKKHEFSTFDLLFETKMKVDENFKKRYFELEQRKQRLFEEREVDKWNIQPLNKNNNMNELLKNYSVARNHMIPNVR